ncbi:MAG: flavin reductase family protein [Dehalococcoidia bacterium]
MSIDTQAYRQIIGQFATGVTVVTTAVDGWLHGMTANALTSVSLDPLLLLVCVDKAAHAHEQIAKAGRFAVNILSAGQQEVSQLFAVSAEAERDSLRGVEYRLSANGNPIIDGALAYVECAVTDRCEGGDHTIFLASVLDGEALSDGPPLLFYQGKYRALES